MRKEFLDFRAQTKSIELVEELFLLALVLLEKLLLVYLLGYFNQIAVGQLYQVVAIGFVCEFSS